MSRHRAIRNRAYSYDDDYDDYGYEDEDDEEEEEVEGAHTYRYGQQQQQHPDGQDGQQAGVPPARQASLSSFLDHATAQHQAPTAPIPQRARPPPSSKHHHHPHAHHHGHGHHHDDEDDAAHPRLATISEAFDAELVDPAFHLIKGSGQAEAFSDDRIRMAVRQANYDADAAMANLLLLPPSSTSSFSCASSTASSSLPASVASSRGTTPSPPPRPTSPSTNTAAAAASIMNSPPPPLPPGHLVRPTPQRRSSAAGLGMSSSGGGGGGSRNNSSNNLLEEVTGRVGGVNLVRSRTPPARVRSASPGPGGMDDMSSSSSTPGNVVASRASLGGLSRDAEVWEEDVLPSSATLSSLPSSGSSGALAFTAEEEGGEGGDREGGKVEKPRITMVVIGHVDAGKSTLMGQVLVATGLVSEREVRKYEREAREMGKASFYLAWLMDEDGEERAHGVTMEIGQKLIELPHRVLTLLDAPGHADFIPQMIMGAAQADVALLVVPATTGEFEAGFAESGNGRDGLGQGQTKEHALLARALGVTQLLVAINKLDAADPPWSQHRYEEMVGALAPFLEQTGFKPERIRYVPVSGLTGENVKEGGREGGPLGGWYTGPSLLTAMDGFLPAAKLLREARSKPLRMVVNDYSPAGKNVAVSVRVLSGGVKAGSKVLILPIGDVATVRAIEVEGRGAETAQAGEHAELTLQGVDIARMSIGSVLCKGKAAVPVSRRFGAQITTLPSLGTPILRGTQFQLHLQSLEMPVNATRLVATLHKPLSEEGVASAEIKQERPRCLTGGVLALVELRCQKPMCVERFDDSRSLGRFVLRQKGETVAVGMITEILADT